MQLIKILPYGLFRVEPHEMFWSPSEEKVGQWLVIVWHVELKNISTFSLYLK